MFLGGCFRQELQEYALGKIFGSMFWEGASGRFFRKVFLGRCFVKVLSEGVF